MAGAPFFFGEADAAGEGWGGSLASGVGLGLGEDAGDSGRDGVGVGEALCVFFFLGEAVDEDSGEGIGEGCLFFGEEEALGLASAAFFLGDGDFSGDAIGGGEGDFSAVAFFFECFRGVGVGVGAKTFLSLVPNDSSARAFAATPATIQITNKIWAVLMVGRMRRESSISAREYAPQSSCHPEPGRRRGTSQLQTA